VGWRKANRLGVLLTNKSILIWIDRQFLKRRAIIICIVVLEKIVESIGLFASKYKVKNGDINQVRLHHVPG
jgi:hypothetical protein